MDAIACEKPCNESCFLEVPYSAFGRISKIRIQITVNASSQVSVSITEKPKAKLSAFDPPTFDENTLNWTPLRYAFEAAVNQTFIPNVKKFIPLRSLLRRKAKSAIERILIANFNYAETLSVLKKQFGDNYLVRRLLYIYLKLIPPKANKISELPLMYERLIKVFINRRNRMRTLRKLVYVVGTGKVFI